jgi:glycosyltransferase involved in cell wall biosynthesis
MEKKKTILIHSNFCKAFTGFGKNSKNILKYLYKTGKYNIVEAANMKKVGDPVLKKLPWKCFGTIPNNVESLPEQSKRAAGYGVLEIDNIIQEVRPDIYLGIEDIWAFTDFNKKPWWGKVTPMIWTTLDSLPILPQAVEFAPKLEHYYVWSSFAEKAFKKLGYDNVKTLRGSLDTKTFNKLKEEDRSRLRTQNSISNDDFVIGFVFRNQLRKSVPNLLDGFKLFKEDHKEAKLLLHTNWSEGWDITSLIEEKGILNDDILTTYYCPSCRGYEVKPFAQGKQRCKHCNEQESETTSVSKGVSETQLNEIYNLMDVYCHPFTSGGQEIPVQEAKLAELITLVTDYSCGEDSCSEESGGLPLSWHEYREPGTQFIKASTDAESINQMLNSVYDMPKGEKEEQEKKSREWVIENFSVEVIGKKLEDIFDSMPYLDEAEDIKNFQYNEFYEMPEGLSNKDFIIDLYKNILNDDVDERNKGYKMWESKLMYGQVDQNSLYHHFINVAKRENLKKPISFEDLLGKDDAGKRVAIIAPGSATDLLLINSLIKNLQKKHEGHNVYVFTKPEFFEYVEDNTYVHKCLPYSNVLDNPVSLEGFGEHEGFFEAAYYPCSTTQNVPCYIHNGK